MIFWSEPAALLFAGIPAVGKINARCHSERGETGKSRGEWKSSSISTRHINFASIRAKPHRQHFYSPVLILYFHPLMDKYRITFETWNNVAQTYREKFMGLDLYNDTYDTFCSLLHKKATVLEVGCGPGMISKYISAKRPDLGIDACDVSPNMIAIAEQEVPAANFFTLDARALHTLRKNYTAIISGFCIPYLSKEDVQKFFRDCAALVEKNGMLYLSFIEGNYEDSGFKTGSTGDRAFVYYYNEAFITSSLKENGFECLNAFRKSHASEIHLVILARK